MESFTFNDHKKNYIGILKGFRRPTWAPIKRTLLQVPHYPGARALDTQTDVRILKIPVGIEAGSRAELQQIKEALTEWLVTDQPCELILDREPNRTYMAMVDESFDVDEFVNLGQGVITFICPMPYKLGGVRNVSAKTDPYNSLKIHTLNQGSVFSEPKFEIQVENPSTFIGISNENGDQYFQMGYPVKVEDKPYVREELVLYDDMLSVVGWTAPSTVLGGTVSGNMKVWNKGITGFVAESFGSGTGWHGPCLKRTIPNGPLEDFKMNVEISNGATMANQMGRVEIALLDENSKVVTRISLSDMFQEVDQNYGFMEVRDENDNTRTLIDESPTIPSVWNGFYGRLYIARVGNYWEADIARINRKTGAYDTEMFRHIIFEDSTFTQKIHQVQVYIAKYADNPHALAMSVHNIKIERINPEKENQIPYIVQKGDLVEIDSSDASIRINGGDAIRTKNFASDYIRIEKSENEITFFPANIGQASVTYRERYK